ncbi:MAG: N-acetylmuramate alpha-1-phosphate uridylyltransferase MurU [Gammaproteobacteria bacterium]
MKAMLLAAGKGTRMLPLTATTPKPLLKAGGRSLIEHQILKLKAAGFGEFVINHAWLGAQIEQALGDGSALGVSIAWSREDEPLETAGGIVRALPLLGREPFAIVNADIWTDYPFARLHHALGAGDLAHLVLVQNPEHHPRGDFVLETGRLRADPDAPRHTYSGIAVFDPELFAGLSDGKAPLLPLLQKAIALERASGEYFTGDWLDVGTPQRLAALDARLRQSTNSADESRANA